MVLTLTGDHVVHVAQVKFRHSSVPQGYNVACVVPVHVTD